MAAERETYRDETLPKLAAEDLVFFDETSLYTNAVRTHVSALGSGFADWAGAVGE